MFDVTFSYIYLGECELSIPTFAIASTDLAELGPGKFTDLVEKFLHADDLLESCAGRIVGRGEGEAPVQVAASGASHELHQALGEAVLLLLCAGLGGFVQLDDLADSEGAPDLGVEL